MTMKTVTVSKSHAIMGVALFAALSVSGVQYYKNGERQSKEEFRANLTEAEIRLLQQELAAERAKPSFDDGFRSCMLHMGGAQQTGSYKDGFDAAVKLLNNTNFADGYHTAIEQFNYQSQGKQIVPKPTEEDRKKKKPL